MRTVGSLFMIMVGFLAGIAFVYSCGGGGSSSSADVAELEARIDLLEAKLAYLVVDDITTIRGLAPPHVIFRGANLHVENGLAHTESINGLGNLIVGYNELGFANSQNRTGSHNLIVGPDHEYPNYGGFVAGHRNRITGRSSSVSGGYRNTASGKWSSVSGGNTNIASGDYSSVSGGYTNTASGGDSSVSGGQSSIASGDYSSVSGGAANTASGGWSSVSGGLNRDAPTSYSWAAGGLLEFL